mgnify:CR=1 FL=1
MPSKSNPGNISVRGGRSTTNSVGRESLDFDILHLLKDLGGAVTPGGVNGQIQFNNSGSFAGSSLIFDSGSGALGLPVGISAGSTVINATPYTVDPAPPQDFAVMVDTVTIGAASSITLPALQIGRIIIVKDGSGAAATHNIDILPNSATESIEGGGSLQITVDWGSVVLQGTQVAGAPTTNVWQVIAMR